MTSPAEVADSWVTVALSLTLWAVEHAIVRVADWQIQLADLEARLEAG